MAPTSHRRSVLGRAAVAILGCIAAGTALMAVPAGAATASNPGIGSSAAMSAPNCDPATKRIKLPYYAAPPCVKPWAAGDDNGGATAQGVTKDKIKVVVLWAELSDVVKSQGNVTDQATGKPGTEPDSITDTNEVLKQAFQTWGRTFDIQFVKASGDDESSQRADAVKVAAMKPFAVLDFGFVHGGGGGSVFQSALKGKVPVVNTYPCCGLIPYSAQSGPVAENAGEWAGKALVGGRAKWAGDDAMKAKPRVFGAIYPGGDQGVDISKFQKEFAKHGGKLAASVSYDLGGSASDASAQAQEQAPTLITKLKDAGVTTVVSFADGPSTMPQLTRAATAQDYFPEWVITGQTYQDIDVVGRLSDQQQMAHAFGLIWFIPWVQDPSHPSDPGVSLYQWYWGKDQGTRAAGATSLLYPLYTGVQLAGPTLNAQTFEKALLKYPPTGGAFTDQVSTLEYSFAPSGEMPARGSAVGWYDADEVAPSQVLGDLANAKGAFMYLDGAKRYVFGKFPKGEPKLFDPKNSVAVLESVPASENVPNYPCDGCPSSGSGPAPAASGSS